MIKGSVLIIISWLLALNGDEKAVEKAWSSFLKVWC